MAISTHLRTLVVALLACLWLPQTGAAFDRAAAPGIEAFFAARSSVPHHRARLVLTAPARGLTVQLFRSGPERRFTRAKDVMLGVPVSPARRVLDGRRRLVLWIDNWPSGLYFARLHDARGRLGFAPIIVRPTRLGEHRVAVVLPTNTWQAYNFRDENGDGVPDTWYGDPHRTTVSFARPFLDRGVPPKFHGYDLGFIQWLARTGRNVDMLSQEDVERTDGLRLRAAYDLIVFPGHHEYVATPEYDAVQRFRDLGGNLAFLSANDFFYRVVRRGPRMTRVGKWRDQGRPEAKLVGVEYVGWNEDRYPNAPYVVTGASAAPWFFRGTGLRTGSRFGTYGIEIDATTSLSPRGIRVLARLPNIFGPGRSGEMTYYTTRAGAKVFAAGSINFGGSALWPTTSALLENLWSRLVSDPPRRRREEP
jgi:hypothetical protein